MPKIYLSPSTQESNPYITGSGSEEYNMNRLADALEPYLYANGIRFVRNTPDMTAASSIAQANRLGGFDFYLALHSNAAAPENSGSVRGVLVFYYPTSAEGKRAADLFAANLKRVYPLPDLVRTVPTTALGEVRQPKYPANLLELGYHDNYADAAWVENNMDAIARELARSLTEYFGLPFIEPQPVVQGTVSTSGSPRLPARLPERRGADHRALAERRVGHGLRHLAGLEHGETMEPPITPPRRISRADGNWECPRGGGGEEEPDRFRKNKHTAPRRSGRDLGPGVRACAFFFSSQGEISSEENHPLTKSRRSRG